MNQTKMLKGYLCAIISAILYGSMPLMAKLIYADGVNPMTLVFLRNALSLPVLAALAFAQNKSLMVPLKALPSMGLISLLGCCITPVLLLSSYEFISSGTATVFHFIYPAVVVLLGMLFSRKGAQWWNILCVAICVVGISLFYTPGQDLNWQGSLLALLSGVTYAFYVLRLSAFRYSQISGFLFSFYVAAVSSAVMLILCLATNQLMLPASPKGWVLCAVFALAVTVGAVVLFQQGTFIIGGERTSILSTLEPITSIFIGVLVFQEPIGPRTIAGSLLVVLASILIGYFDMQKAKMSHQQPNR